MTRIQVPKRPTLGMKFSPKIDPPEQRSSCAEAEQHVLKVWPDGSKQIVLKIKGRWYTSYVKADGTYSEHRLDVHAHFPSMTPANIQWLKDVLDAPDEPTTEETSHAPQSTV